jgi:tetratricopeptide (TPR) repeat protein
MSSRPAPGRRPDGLFDNRYRIERSFPRGRSGEVLRAFDTLNDDQPVVIKRPALQDAPPMRAGQEQNILNEKRALERLGGHPSVPTLRQMGIFRVGGQAQHYIVLEEALGVPLDILVRQFTEYGQRLPDLETLVIFDALLDVIQAAHDRKMVYNNLEPANLYWDREHYTLKIVGWENALFLDTDVLPPTVNRATDITQIGQLLYFVVSGGQQFINLDSLAALSEDVPPQMVTIISRCVSTEASQRYSSVVTIRQELDTLRGPLEELRDAPFENARARLPEAEVDELEMLRETVQRALDYDPGYPAGHALLAEIETRIRQITVQNEMHALSVYILSGNMGRAVAVIEELRPKMDAATQPILAYLKDACEQLQAAPVLPLSAGFAEALGPLLEGDVQTAAELLATTHEPRTSARQQQNLLAERLSLFIPGIVLLRPPLALLEDQLAGRTGSAELRDALRAIVTRLDRAVPPSIQLLRRQYQDTVNALVEMEGELRPLNGDNTMVAEAQGARFAAQRVLELLDVATSNVFSDPQRAADALEKASAIDPGSTGFKTIAGIFESFHAEMINLRNFVPARDGANISQFLEDAQARLRPYGADVADPQFQAMIQGIDDATAAWLRVADFITLGGRRPTITACQQAADAIQPLNPSLARWFNEYAKRIEHITRIDELNPNAALGAALAQGWDQWDRGRAAEAKAAGEQALTHATNDGEKHAARRLINLSEALGSWLANDGPLNPKRTDQADERVSEILLPEEEAVRRKFSKQMPDAQIYLRAMSKGIVEPMRETSSAGVRALFFHYVLRGMLALQSDGDDASFWREAAIKTLSTARTHPAFQALDTAITRRQLVREAVRALNEVKHTSNLGPARLAVRAPMASAQLEAATQSIQSVDEALRQWTEGDFRKARQAIDNAAERIAFAETVMGHDLKPFKTWLQDLGASAEIVQQARRTIEQIALVPADDPNPAVIEAHLKIIEITRRDLGESYTTKLRQWRDTYNSIRDLYLDQQLTKAEKLRLYEGYADVPTFEQQPALPILRHWLDLIKKMRDSAPFSAPFIPLRGPVSPGSAESDQSPSVSEIISTGDEKEAEVTGSGGEPVEPIRSGSPLMLIIGVVVLIGIIATLGVLVLRTTQPPEVPFTPGASAQGSVPAVLAAGATEEATSTSTETETSTPSPTFTDVPTATPPTLPPTITKAVPTYTSTSGTPTPEPPTPVKPGVTISPTSLPAGVLPGDSPVPTNPSLTPPTNVPTAQSGDYDMLEALAKLPNNKITWNRDWFGPAEGGWQLGTSTLRPNNPLQVVRLGPDVLTPLFGPEAATKLKRVDATIELDSYDKSLLPTGNVYYGLGMESRGGQRVSVQATLLQATVAGIVTSQNGVQKQKTQVPFTKLRTTFTLERNDDNTLSLYYNGQLVGQSSASFAMGTPVTIYLYTSAGGVVTKVTAFKVHLE